MKIEKRAALIYVGLVFMITYALFVRTASFGFVNYDDDRYVYANPSITNQVTCSTWKNIFSRENVTLTGHWHPVTILSLMLDRAVFGVNASEMHVHNAVFHALNAGLLFFLLCFILGEGFGYCRLRGEKRRYLVYAAAAVGALFWALHPLRVESVAWVASRKDVVSLFWFLLGAVAYAKELGVTREKKVVSGDFTVYLFLSALCFTVAFLAKATAIVFPVVMLLVEYATRRRVVWSRLSIFVFITFVYVIVTMVSQVYGGAMAPTADFPLMRRLPTALTGILHYVVKTVWPSALAPIYPYSNLTPTGAVLLGALLLGVVGLWLLKALWPIIQRYPPLPFLRLMATNTESVRPRQTRSRLLIGLGTLWFLVCLLPVSGVFRQVGSQAYADRYTYLAGIGFSIMVSTFALCALIAIRRSVVHGGALIAFLFALAIGYGVCSNDYIGKWRDSLTLWNYVVKQYPDNHIAHCNMGAIYYERGDYVKALECISKSAVLTSSQGYIMRLESSLWNIAKLGPYDNVLLIEVNASDPHARLKYLAMGLIAESRNIMGAAEAYYRKAIELDDKEYSPWMLLGLLLSKQETRYPEAVEALERALVLKPGDAFIKKSIRDGKKALAKKGT